MSIQMYSGEYNRHVKDLESECKSLSADIKQNPQEWRSKTEELDRKIADFAWKLRVLNNIHPIDVQQTYENIENLRDRLYRIYELIGETIDLTNQISGSRFPITEKKADPEAQVQVQIPSAAEQTPIPEVYDNIETLTSLQKRRDLTSKEKIKIYNILESYDGVKQVEQFKKIMFLPDKGCLSLLQKALASNPQENWELISELMTLGVLPEDNPAMIQTLTGDLDFTQDRDVQLDVIRSRLLENSEFRSNLIELLRYELFNNPDFAKMRPFAKLIRKYQVIFNNHGDLNFRVGRVIAWSKDEALKLENNPYNLHRALSLLREGQIPKRLPFEYKGRICLFTLPRDEVIYNRKDIPSGLNQQTLKSLFVAIEQRMEGNPDIAIAVLNALGEYESEVAESLEEKIARGKSEFRALKSNFLSDPTIVGLTNLPSDENAVISRESFYFYSLLNNWLSESSDPKNETSLSAQETLLLLNSVTIYGCGPGKKGKITELYKQSDPSTRLKKGDTPEVEAVIGSTEEEELRKRVTGLLNLEPIRKHYEEFVGKLFESEAFIKKLIRQNQSLALYEPYHQKQYLKNKFSKLVNLPHDLSFEAYSGLILNKVLDVTEKQFMMLFLMHAEEFLASLPQLLEEAESDPKLREEIVKNVNLINSRHKFMYYRDKFESKLITEEEFKQHENRFKEEILARGKPENIYQHIEEEKKEGASISYKEPLSLCYDIEKLIKPDKEIFIYEEVEHAEPGEDYIKSGIKDEFVSTLFQKLDIYSEKSLVLKIDSSKPASCDAIISMIQEKKPITTLDLSHCTWLSIEDILRIISECGPLTTLNLSGCTQLPNKEMNRILARCWKVQTFDLTGCTQLTELNIPLRKPEFILNECNDIKGVLKFGSGARAIRIEIPLKNERIYRNKHELANRVLEMFPEQTSACLEHLGFSVNEAVDFCIEKKLKTVDLIKFENLVTDAHVIKLTQNNNDIKHIFIHSLIITDESVMELAKNCPRLKTLSISGSYTGMVGYIARLQRDHFSVSGGVTDASVVVLAKKCPRLTIFSLSTRCGTVSKALFQSLRVKRPNLKIYTH